MGTVTFGKLLSGKVEAVHWSCSVSFFFSPPPSAFRKLLPQQKRSAALSSEWLNNSGGSDFSRTSMGLCLWSNMTECFDTLKTLPKFDSIPKRGWWKVALAEGVSEWWPSCSVPSASRLLWKAPHSKCRQGKSCQGFSHGSAVRHVLLKLFEFITVLWWLHCDRNLKTEKLVCTTSRI